MASQWQWWHGLLKEKDAYTLNLPRILSASMEAAKASSQHARLRLFRLELPDPDSELFPRYHLLQKFYLFQKLPTELRLKIWNLVPRGRRLIVTIDDYDCLRTNTPTPVLFRVNRESRIQTLHHYPTSYVMASYPPDRPQPALHRHYFDPTVDTIHIPEKVHRYWNEGF